MGSAPSTSYATMGEDDNASSSEKIINEAVFACIKILELKKIISGKVMENYSDRAWLLANDMADAILEVIQNWELAEEDELFANDEILEEDLNDSLPIQSQTSSGESTLSGETFTE